MEIHVFDVHRKYVRGWCFKCKRRCRYRRHAVRSNLMTLLIAGTPCTTWSRMGQRSKWTTSDFSDFHYLALHCLLDRAGCVCARMHRGLRRARAGTSLVIQVFPWPDPTHTRDLILGEILVRNSCAKKRKQYMAKILCENGGSEAHSYIVCTMACVRSHKTRYVVSTLVFSPCDLGIPSGRKRRYTVLLHRKRCRPCVQYSLKDFGDLFFRRLISTGHAYYCATEKFVQRERKALAKARRLPDVQPNGAAWSYRDLLPGAQRTKLVGYEKLCRRKRLRAHFIVNLQQNTWFQSSLSQKAPCLMTRTSSLWSMVHERLLLPIERLAVHGVNPFDDRKFEDRFAIEMLALRWNLSRGQLAALIGNGMHQAAIGVVELFVLSSVVRTEDTAPSSAVSASQIL